MPDPPVVLIADDDRSIADMIGLLVEDLGLTPLVAYNGKQALELARATPPAILLVDLMMPVMSGTAFLQALREERTACGDAMPPIILMTAASHIYTDGVDADAFLRKPFDLSELEALLERYLGSGHPPAREPGR
jgi:CheY-like chemotaxis protein